MPPKPKTNDKAEPVVTQPQANSFSVEEMTEAIQSLNGIYKTLGSFANAVANNQEAYRTCAVSMQELQQRIETSSEEYGKWTVTSESVKKTVQSAVDNAASSYKAINDALGVIKDAVESERQLQSEVLPALAEAARELNQPSQNTVQQDGTVAGISSDDAFVELKADVGELKAMMKEIKETLASGKVARASEPGAAFEGDLAARFGATCAELLKLFANAQAVRPQ